jgi:hypothetical protein
MSGRILPRILRQTPAEHASALARLRQEMYGDLAGPGMFGELTDGELTELMIRLESGERRVAAIAAVRLPDGLDYGIEAAMLRYETGLLVGDVLMARDRLWGELG